MTTDPINPSYYQSENGLESIRVIEVFVPDKPYRWAPLKYLFRAGKKSGQDEVQDLRKAIWWIEREIGAIEKQREQSSLHPSPPLIPLGRCYTGGDCIDRAVANAPPYHCPDPGQEPDVEDHWNAGHALYHG